TNIDSDHLDHYGDEDAVEAAFVRFGSGARELLVASADDPRTRSATALASGPRIVTLPRSEDLDARLVAAGADGAFRVVWDGVEHEARLAVPGEHNVVNATGVFAVLAAMGHDPAAALRALETFAGTGRRFEHHATVRGVQ